MIGGVAADFLHELIKAVPYRIYTILNRS